MFESRIWSGSTMAMSGLVGYLHFGDPVDMLYSELITEHFNAVASVPSFGSSFVPQGHTNLPTFQFLLIAGIVWSPSLKPFGYKAERQVLRHMSNQVW